METIIKEGRTRREFLKGAGAVVAGGVVVGVVGSQLGCEELTGVAVSYAKAKGYLVYDSQKCCTCQTCMVACSTVHEGEANLSLARLQRTGSTFGRFPESDIVSQVCRQCVFVPCIEACEMDALRVDAANGNVRTVDETKCDGCQKCFEACPYVPSMAVWNHDKGVSMTCDLCENTPYWSEEGGVNGKQVCVELCPMLALSFVTQTPSQKDTAGYDVNLRG